MVVDLIAETKNRPGKIPTRLLVDLQHYDPTLETRNVLCEPPPYLDERSAATAAKVVFGRHTHILVLRKDHSTLPSTRDNDTSRPWTAVTICESCRAHIEVRVDSSEPTLKQSGPCPTKDNPMHHLCYNSRLSKPISKTNSVERWVDVRAFDCSSASCPTVVSIKTRPPILSMDDVRVMTDPKKIQERKDKFKSDEKKEPRFMDPFKALKTMHTYLKNLLGGEKRNIPKSHELFLLALGAEGGDIMRKAHFMESPPGVDEGWVPPSVSDKDSDIYRDIEEMIAELEIIMDKRNDGKEQKFRLDVKRAEPDIKRILRSEYEPTNGWPIDLDKQEHPFYAALGIVYDVKDPIVLWTYERQRDCDPAEAPYYFQCLNVLANGRNSEMLQLEAVKLRSQGEYTTDDVTDACKSLGIDSKERNEDLIIGIFRSRLADSPRQETQLRESLRIIGKSRDSAKISLVARKAFTDVKGAYSWLGVPEDTSDEFILSTYSVRILDEPSHEPTAKEALKAIAETRQSPILLSHLESGGVYEHDQAFDIVQAYSLLGIEDSTLSDELITDVFNLRLLDDPGKTLELRKALRVIAEDRNSIKIKEYLQTGPAETSQSRGSANSPVGLENIGNTCYLNSLLQFYFTIKPLRDMILNLDEYQEGEITEEVVERKRVGGRKVTKTEIERAKKFAGHLRTLFQDLIKSSSASITPERDLAYLALVSSKDEAEKRASVSDERPVIDIDKMDIDQISTSAIQDEDAASESTLVGDLTELLKDEDEVMTDQDKKEPDTDSKENVPPPAAAPLAEEPSPLQDIPMNGEEPTITAPLTPPPEIEISTPPDRPAPPVPSRPRRNTATDINMFGRQQDVTECIGNVMFQIEAAIKPTRIDDSGEQIDLVKDYFYGRTKQTLAFPDSAETRTKEELFSHLLVNVAEGDRDMYSALDSSFDIEQVDLEGRKARRYLSISHLPPVLQIQVQRVQFDREKGTPYKSNAHLNFPETLFMDRYMDTDDPALKTRRDESWKWKEELRQLTKRKATLSKTSVDEDMATVLDITRSWIEDLQTAPGEDDMNINPALGTILEQRAAAVRRELEGIDKDIRELESRINQQFTDLRRFGYRIHSVFIHRGSVSFGHYWIYIYDFDKGMFRKYNDQYISEVVDTSEVFTHSNVETSPATPYFLVFVKEEQLEITEAVKREIVE